MKLHKAWKILIVACASALTVPGRAAALPASENTDVIAIIDSRIARLDSLIFRTTMPAAQQSVLAGTIACEPDSSYAIAVDALTRARISEIKAESGIQLTGQTYYRADGDIGLDDEDEAVSRYNGKIQAEARWYFLQSGLLKRKSRIAEERLKGDIAVLEHERQRTNPGIYARREQLQVTADSTLASYMLHRVENLKLLEDAYMYLLQNENISGDELLRVLDDRADAERRLSTITTAPQPSGALCAVQAATVSIDTTAIIAEITNTDIDLQLLDMKGQLLDRQATNTTWWSDVRLAPFVRYSHYFRHAMPASNNVDAGLSFTIPVNTQAAKQRAGLRAEKLMLECQRDTRMEQTIDRVHYINLENERLNRAITGECSRAASLKKYLKARRQAYDNRAGEYNRLAALKEYNSYLRCLENIVDLQYKRDCLLIEIQALAPAINVLEHCKFTPITEPLF